MMTQTGIQGLRLRLHKAFKDERGVFTEPYRFGKGGDPIEESKKQQINIVYSNADVIRGMHYHTRQYDYWFMAQGSIIGNFVDLRQDSSTFLKTERLRLSGWKGVLIPPGVAHGYMTHDDDAVLCYIVTNHYDGSDEYKIKYDDPALGLMWDT